MKKSKIALCKTHYEDFINWPESYKFDIEKSNINDCYYCEINRRAAITLDSVIMASTVLKDEECSTGICPVR